MNTKTLITVFVLSLFGITFNNTSEVSIEHILLNNSEIIMEVDGDGLHDSFQKDFDLEGIYRLSIREFEGVYYYLAEGYKGAIDQTKFQTIKNIDKIIDVKKTTTIPCKCITINKKLKYYSNSDPCNPGGQWICNGYCSYLPDLEDY